MKILIIRSVATILNRKNYNIQEEGIAKEFIKFGHTCDLVFYNGEKTYKKEIVKLENGMSFNIHWVPARKLYDCCIYNFNIIKKLADEADIIQVEEYEQLFSCMIALKYSNKTVIYHGPYDCKYKRVYRLKSKIYDLLFLRRMIKKNIFFATKSNLAKRTIIQKGFKNVVTVPVGLDLNKFTGERYNISLPKIDKKTFKLLYIGVLEDRRNILFMFDILHDLRKKGINAKLTIVGEGKQEYIDLCKNKINQLNLKNYVEFRGKVEQSKLIEIYNEHQVFLLPTRYEIFGMVLLEALYFGRIVLTTYNGGSEILIDNYQNGLVLENDNRISWVNELEKIYYEKYDIESISKNATEKIMKEYVWKKSAEKFIDYYNIIINRN